MIYDNTFFKKISYKIPPPIIVSLHDATFQKPLCMFKLLSMQSTKKEFYAVVKDDVDSNKNSWVSMSRVCLRYMKDIIAL